LFFIQRRSKDSEEPDAEPDEEEELALRAHLEIEAELNEMSDERSHDKARQQGNFSYHGIIRKHL
jgi:hypothetical protein